MFRINTIKIGSLRVRRARSGSCAYLIDNFSGTDSSAGYRRGQIPLFLPLRPSLINRIFPAVAGSLTQRISGSSLRSKRKDANLVYIYIYIYLVTLFYISRVSFVFLGKTRRRMAIYRLEAVRRTIYELFTERSTGDYSGNTTARTVCDT